MADEDHYAPHLFGPSRKSHPLPYPTQTKKAPQVEERSLAGELRGYYGLPQFNPHASQYGDVRYYDSEKKKRKKHGGVDIYSPYDAFPHEVPIYAVCRGRVEFHYDNESPDDLGNRGWLYPHHAPNDRVILGHLNRFVGHDREVWKGDLLGFSGCSGNANALGECTNRGDLNINSGHVHVAYRRHPSGTVVDPLEMLGWSLRFAAIEEPISLAKWTADGNLLDKPKAPDFELGYLRTDSKRSERIGKSEDPSRLSKPFENIDFDRRTAVAATARFYKLALGRLLTDEIEHPKAKFHEFGVKQFGKSVADVAKRLERLLSIERELAEISREAEKPLAERRSLEERTQLAQTRTVEFLFECLRILWLALAGDAMLSVAKSPGKLHNEKKNEKDPVPGGWPGLVPRSGIGIGGRVILVALGNGQAALQASFLKKLADDAANPGKKKVVAYSNWTLSVSFGAGTPWHAVLDRRFSDVAGALPDSVARLFEAYAHAVYDYTYILSALSKVVCDKSKVVDEDALKRYFGKVTVMMGAVAGDGEEVSPAKGLLAVLQEIGKKEDSILTLLKTIAETSGDAATQAAECLDPKVAQLERIRSAYEMIWIEKAE